MKRHGDGTVRCEICGFIAFRRDLDDRAWSVECLRPEPHSQIELDAWLCGKYPNERLAGGES